MNIPFAYKYFRENYNSGTSFDRVFLLSVGILLLLGIRVERRGLRGYDVEVAQPSHGFPGAIVDQQRYGRVVPARRARGRRHAVS